MSNPNQEIIESRLASYVDGELEDAGERLAIEQHLQQNPQYRQMLNDLRTQREMLRGLPREAAPVDLTDSLNGQLERSVLLDSQPADRDERGMRIYAFPRVLAAAAIVLLTLGLGAIVYFVLPNRTTRTVAILPTNPAPVSSSAIKDSPMSADKSVAETPDPDDAPVVPEPAPTDSPAAAGSVAMLAEGLAKDRALADEKAGIKQSVEQLRFAAKRMELSRADGISKAASARDAELDEFAKNVSQDPRVRGLLAGGPGASAVPNAEPVSSKDAVVMVVRAGDVQQVQQQLGRFFAQSNIDWQAAPRPVELALNTTLSQQDGQGLLNGAVAGTRTIDPRAVETDRELAERKKLSEAEAAAPEDAAPASPIPAAEPTATARLLKSNGAREAQKAGPATTQPGESDSFAYRSRSLPIDRSIDQRKDDFAANASPVNNLYVARRLSRRQAQELTTCLTQSGDVRQANVLLEAMDAANDHDVAPASNGAMASNLPANGAPSAQDAGLMAKARGQSVGGAGGNSAPSPAPGSFGKGGLQGSDKASAPTQQNAGRDGADNKLDAAAPALRGQAAGIAPRTDDRRGVATAAAKPQATLGITPATRPAAADEEADMVNVVIVVENDSPVSRGMITEPFSQAAPAPAAAPAAPAMPAAAAPAPVAKPAPATRPSIVIPAAPPTRAK